jgi:hypothetical protein
MLERGLRYTMPVEVFEVPSGEEVPRVGGGISRLQTPDGLISGANVGIRPARDYLSRQGVHFDVTHAPEVIETRSYRFGWVADVEPVDPIMEIGQTGTARGAEVKEIAIYCSDEGPGHDDFFRGELNFQAGRPDELERLMTHRKPRESGLVVVQAAGGILSPRCDGANVTLWPNDAVSYEFARQEGGVVLSKYKNP